MRGVREARAGLGASSLRNLKAIMQINISTNFPDVARQLANLQKDIGEKAVASALNKTVALAKTAMSREIRREFNISTTAVNDSLRIRRATAVRSRLMLEASLESRSKRGRSLNLINFIERSVTMAAARQRMKGGEGGTYKLGNSTVRKALELRFKIRRTGPKKVIKGAFIGNDGRTVFIREGSSRLPIKALQTVDVAQMFNTKRINARVVQMINTRFPAIFANDAKFFTAKFNGGR